MKNIEPIRFAETVLETIYDLDKVGFDPSAALKGVLAEVEDLKALNDTKVLKNRHTYFQITKTTPADYEEQFFEVSPGRFVFAGIRHVNGDKTRPFVHMLLGFDPTRIDLSLIEDLAREKFSLFSPKHVSIWLRPSSLLAQELEGKGLAARRYIVGNVKDISGRSVPLGYERIQLLRLIEAPEPQWYQAAYAAFHQMSPDLAAWVPMTDREELQNCVDDGLLYRVLVDGNHAGLIGGRREPLLGRPGVYMTELLLTAPWRGQGLAQALQRNFIDHLSPEIDLVWGTIDAKNLPSTRAALKVGRVPIRTEFFLPLS